VEVLIDIVRLTTGVVSTAITRDAGEATLVESAATAGNIVTSKASPTSDTRIMFEFLLCTFEPSED